MSASSRTATAEGRKKTTIASTHRSRLASPNWLAAVVSHRSPTIAVMLNSTTSRSRITRGSWSGTPGMNRGGEPPDAAAQRRATHHVGREMPATGHAPGEHRRVTASLTLIEPVERGERCGADNAPEQNAARGRGAGGSVVQPGAIDARNRGRVARGARRLAARQIQSNRDE